MKGFECSHLYHDNNISLYTLNDDLGTTVSNRPTYIFMNQKVADNSAYTNCKFNVSRTYVLECKQILHASLKSTKPIGKANNEIH